MDAVHRELDEIKMEMQKLKAEYVTKTELCKRLREAHTKQCDKFRKVELGLENQDLELNAKSEENFLARENYEHIESRLCKKESFLKHPSSVDDDIRTSCGERVQNLEGENKILVLDLKEATGKIHVLEIKVSASNEEIEGLVSILLNLVRTRLETEKKDEAPRELRQRETIRKLEEEYRGAQDQLKWKNEHFKHLEQAFEMVKDQFRLSKEEWEMEKSALLEEVSTLQSSLYSQTIISDGLKTQLMMCNQALAHEASKKRLLNVQADVGITQFENMLTDFEEPLSEADTLIPQRKEVAILRNSFGAKETHSKEMESRITRLEQENGVFRNSLKKLTVEAHLNKAGVDSLLLKLQNKLQGLEAVHNNCSMNLKAKETDWSSQLTRTKGDKNNCTSEPKGKNKQMQDLQEQLEGCRSSLEALSEKLSLVFLLLKSDFSEAHGKLLDAKQGEELHDKENGESGMLQRKQLDMKDCALKEALDDLVEEKEKVLSSKMKVQTLMEQKQSLMKGNLEKHKKLLELSKRCQLRLEESNLHLENAHMKDKKEFSEALETTWFELGEKIREVAELEIELQNWKSAFEGLNFRLKESEDLRDAQDVAMLTLGQEKESLLQIGKVRERRIGDLQQQVVLLETAVDSKKQLLESVQQEKENCLRIAQVKDSTIENLCQEIDRLTQESSMRKEFEELSEALEKAGHLAKIEIEGKNMKIAELEKSVHDLVHDLESHKDSLLHSKQEAEKLEASFTVKMLEMNQFKEQSRRELRRLEGLIEKANVEKKGLLKDISKLASEREKILVDVESICDRVGDVSCDNVKMIDVLGKILQISEEESELKTDSIAVDKPKDPTRNNVNDSSPVKRPEMPTEKRLPLKDLNH